MSEQTQHLRNPQIFGQSQVFEQSVLGSETAPQNVQLVDDAASDTNGNTPPIVLQCPVKMGDTVVLMLVGISLMLFGVSLLPYGEGGQFLGWTFLLFGLIASIYALCTGGVQKLIAYIDERYVIRDKRYKNQAYIGGFVGFCLGLYLPPMIPVLAVFGASIAVRNAKKLDIMTSEQATKAKNIWGS